MEPLKFVLVPKPFKHLSSRVIDVLWNAVNKSLHIQIQETEKLEVIEWMQYIKKQQVEIKKGPFIDLNQDAISLQLQDQTGNVVACLKFKNISLEDHSCNLIMQTKNLDLAPSLIHVLVLGYQELEITYKKEQDAVPFVANTVADEEWRKDP